MKLRHLGLATDFMPFSRATNATAFRLSVWLGFVQWIDFPNRNENGLLAFAWRLLGLRMWRRGKGRKRKETQVAPRGQRLWEALDEHLATSLSEVAQRFVGLELGVRSSFLRLVLASAPLLQNRCWSLERRNFRSYTSISLISAAWCRSSPCITSESYQYFRNRLSAKDMRG